MKLELLAPAGSIAGMKAVIAAGADAIYIGGNRFGARAYAENPNEEELVQAIRYAHLRGVRVYLTVNTLLRDEELAELPGWLAPYVQAGLDAVLVQDLGVLRLLRREFPHLTIHASTQMTVTGPEGAMLLRELGVARVVPAREMSLSELSEIHKKSGLEVEAFVHGALCVCFSGQCLFSSLLGGRSGNRGRCAQPCRLPYRFALGFGDKAGSKKTIQMRNIEVSSQESCAAGELLSPKDLCALDILPKMAAAGVVSFKIEGRMKQPAYAAGVVEIYRKYLDLLESGNPYRVNPKDRERLYTLFNRGGFTDGYFTRRNGPEMMAPKGRVLTNAEEKARAELYASMDDKYVFPEDALGICGKAFIFAGQPAKLSVSLTDARGVLANAHFNTTVLGDEVLWAKNAPLQEEKIRNQLLKTGGSGFVFRSLEILTDGKAFLPSKSLNELRRKALAALEEEILGGFPALVAEEGVFKQENVSWEAAAKINQGRCVVSAVCDTLPQATAAFMAGADRIYLDAAAFYAYAEGEGLLTAAGRLSEEFGNGRLWIATPLAERFGMAGGLYDKAAEMLNAGIGGFLVRSFEAFAHMHRLGLSEYCLVDAPVYTWNQEARTLVRELGFAGDVAPYELSKAQLSGRNMTKHPSGSKGCSMKGRSYEQFRDFVEASKQQALSAIEDETIFSEVQIYGRQALMVTAQCLRKNAVGCTKRPGLETLIDRTGTAFPVRCNCTFCSNIIYNSVQHSLYREIPFFKNAGFTSCRLAFTVESPEEVHRLVELAKSAMNRSVPIYEEPIAAYTRGQFSKGVE